ncbi:MAG: glycosyltransferase family 2 protein, partial [Alphaproteobacteria bacterium]|nr:glycosyltransferase family 2 protein [Alphaproteobacteria bacterium]
MSMKSPSLTVIVPTRNRPSAISALQSVVAEAAMLDHLHVVVIDDHSDDGSHRAVAAWAAVQGARATFRRNARQRGPGASRNLGLDLATGDYTLFLDSDDRIAPGAIGRM